MASAFPGCRGGVDVLGPEEAAPATSTARHTVSGRSVSVVVDALPGDEPTPAGEELSGMRQEGDSKAAAAVVSGTEGTLSGDEPGDEPAPARGMLWGVLVEGDGAWEDATVSASRAAVKAASATWSHPAPMVGDSIKVSVAAASAFLQKGDKIR